ncbi:Butyrophilin-like protein 1 Precursor [Channa argus]|uniref:Butyrophilin-like protein 1 n=1 Tax=Channa argus TaxID=215402 RepID=A0A6G1PJE6_CHAAH|nr:Butyrophilin-like protein 1 Precursor [Channa argus]
MKTTTQHLFFIMALTAAKTMLTLSHGSDVITVVVSEGDNAILPCSLSNNQNIVQKLFDWKKYDKEVFLYDAGVHYNNGRDGQDELFQGRVFHFPQHLKFGNASIVIKNTKVTDSGDYTCNFPHLEPRQIFHIKLIVEPILKDRSEEMAIAVREPYTRLLGATENGVLLQCEVRDAYPKPKVEWQDSDGIVLSAEDPQVSERRGHFNVILRTTVTKTATNCFFCEVKQDDIGHVVNASIIVPEKLFEDKSCQVAHAWIGGWFLGVLSVAVFAALALFVRRVWKKGSQLEDSFSI